MRKIIIAIDGYSSCGKSTMAKGLAREIGYIYIDTGAMYRAVALYCIKHELYDSSGVLDEEALKSRIDDVRITFQLNPETGMPMTFLDGECVEERIRTMEVSSRVSRVAALPFVREVLVRKQQDMGRGGGVVMDGRDIGTVVFPNAELKVFVTASPEIRARRRYDELCAKGQAPTYDEILQNVEERDRIDINRAVSPLRKADDALLLDNTHLTIEEQKTWLREQYERVVRDA